MELFQCKEKPIIILSTVRSRTKSIGFLDNPKRLNVAFTRAQALLILIGNPVTLQDDGYWHKFIEYCIENNAICGIPFKLEPLKVEVEKLAEIEDDTDTDVVEDVNNADQKETVIINDIEKIMTSYLSNLKLY